MYEVMDEGGDEHGLAGAGKPGNAEPHGWRAASGRGIEHVVKDDARLVGNGREGRTRRHLKEISDAISSGDAPYLVIWPPFCEDRARAAGVKPVTRQQILADERSSDTERPKRLFSKF